MVTKNKETNLLDIIIISILVVGSVAGIVSAGRLIEKPWENSGTFVISNGAGIPFQEFRQQVLKITSKQNTGSMCSDDRVDYCIIGRTMNLETAQKYYGE